MKIEGSREYIYAEIRERLLCFEHIGNGNLHEYITDNHMVAKIADFGSSRLDEKSQTMDANRCVTLGYCCPEYLLGGKMSVRSDIYSLGVIIIELVTGCKEIPANSNVLRRWRHRWKKSLKETPWAYQQLQITKCIGIGLHCQESDPYKRPFIWDVIHDINKTDGTLEQTSNADESDAEQIRPHWDDDMLGIEPLKLHFHFEPNKQISCLLQLANDTTASIAFSIQPVSPMPYCIQPNKGIVPPLSSCAVDITLQLQSKPPKDMQHLGEFVVRSTKVADGITTKEITSDMFSKVSSEVVDEVNVDVVFDMPLLLEET
ncbi:cysteine-rich receptor-like protein kinase 24 [Triticum aestivum]|uniref:Putative cysteine-rich receptor-like protein kinase 33 n=1 Tax=Aegilops tauschii TaxID=37682 RepID=M8BVD5_AEGTA|nr:cysteine-rich receptor-like protein kinase 24 [Triticum aestivum]